MAEEHPEQALWVYAVTTGLAAERLGTDRGVGGAPVRPLTEGELTALVSPVDLAEFGEEALRRNLEDLDWLAATARAHDTVVTAAARAATAAVPLRLATVYLGEDRVRGLLAERRADFTAALELLAGRTEWGVKAYADPDALAEDAAAPAEGSGQGAGTAYLLRRKAQLSAREAAQREAAAHAEHLHTALARLAVSARRHPPQDPALSRERGWMVLNGAYLVDDDRAEELARQVEALAGTRRGVRLELTGPWPPYSFAGVVQ
ncbi:GvpL/GvpF family gas vesicle protein [Prauserella muralis]|uniref:Gas vesicle protein GvpFL n=1 Tax=Prauserella muralis TaxID=588067 RepID=A0A2V4AGJ9_9PSEU|nr:GvpL/GvpF family gas vesicle protein [Prauserella muralis]PXY19062.1 gas vesicle protein GvpFL [Prauserella muralis]TWE28959.1 gas vesicle protein GvpL/GvpF [Prauserella muralis]